MACSGSLASRPLRRSPSSCQVQAANVTKGRCSYHSTTGYLRGHRTIRRPLLFLIHLTSELFLKIVSRRRCSAEAVAPFPLPLPTSTRHSSISRARAVLDFLNSAKKNAEAVGRSVVRCAAPINRSRLCRPSCLVPPPPASTHNRANATLTNMHIIMGRAAKIPTDRPRPTEGILRTSCLKRQKTDMHLEQRCAVGWKDGIISNAAFPSRNEKRKTRAAPTVRRSAEGTDATTPCSQSVLLSSGVMQPPFRMGVCARAKEVEAELGSRCTSAAKWIDDC